MKIYFQASLITLVILLSSLQLFAKDCAPYLTSQPLSENPEQLIFKTAVFGIRSLHTSDEVQAALAIQSNSPGPVTSDLSQYTIERSLGLSQKTLSDAIAALKDENQRLRLHNLGVFDGTNLIGLISFQEYSYDWNDKILNQGVHFGNVIKTPNWMAAELILSEDFKDKAMVSEQLLAKVLDIAFNILRVHGMFMSFGPSDERGIANATQLGFEPLGAKLPVLKDFDVYFKAY